MGTCVTVAASPNRPTPDWGSLTFPRKLGRGKDRGRKGAGLQEMVGEGRGCATLGWHGGRGQVTAVGPVLTMEAQSGWKA